MFQKYIMNTAVIILGVLLIVVTYLVFFVFTGSQSLTAKVDLGSPQTAIPSGDISDPGSVRYSFETWVYVYQFDGTGGKHLFSRGSTSTSTSAHSKNIGLKFADTSPILNLEYTVFGTEGTGTGQISTADKYKTLAISNNFPIQTWTQVIVSVDNNYIDVYMNGKLVKSINVTLEAPSTSSSIEYGTPKAYLAKFVRNTYPIDPQTAWDHYSSGNGISSSVKSMIGNYGATITFNKDAAEYSKLQLF
jgi:hypothetical protein